MAIIPTGHEAQAHARAGVGHIHDFSYNLSTRISQQELLMNESLQLSEKESRYVNPSKLSDPT